MQVYLDLSHPQQGQLNPDLSRLEAAAQPYDSFGTVVDTDHHILLVVALETIDL